MAVAQVVRSVRAGVCNLPTIVNEKKGASLYNTALQQDRYDFSPVNRFIPIPGVAFSHFIALIRNLKYLDKIARKKEKWDVFRRPQLQLNVSATFLINIWADIDIGSD